MAITAIHHLSLYANCIEYHTQIKAELKKKSHFSIFFQIKQQFAQFFQDWHSNCSLFSKQHSNVDIIMAKKLI